MGVKRRMGGRLFFRSSLSQRGLLQQMTIDGVPYMTFTSHSSGGWEVSDQVADRFDSCLESASWLGDGFLHTVLQSISVYMVIRLTLPCKGTNPIPL